MISHYHPYKTFNMVFRYVCDMSHRAIINQDGMDRVNFFAKSNEILKYIHEIEKFFNWDERKVLEQAADIITSLVNKKMNDQSDNKKIFE